MNMPSEVIWERRDCVSAEVEGSLVLLDLERLVYHSLNATASAIWEALDSPSTTNSVVLRLQDRFDVEAAHCRASVDRALTELEAQHLVTRTPLEQAA